MIDYETNQFFLFFSLSYYSQRYRKRGRPIITWLINFSFSFCVISVTFLAIFGGEYCVSFAFTNTNNPSLFAVIEMILHEAIPGSYLLYLPFFDKLRGCPFVYFW